MDSRVVQNQVRENDEHYPNIDASQQVTHGAEEQHLDQKKSVLNKVKAKARRIKDTIKKHGNQVLDRGHENNNDQHTPDDHDLDEDDEISEDSQVNETPIHGSEEIKTATPTSEQVENLWKSGTDFGGTTGTTVEEQPRYEAKTNEVVSPKDVMASETSSGEKDDTKDIKLDHMLERSAISESEDVITATPTSEQVENLGKTGTDFGGTTGTSTTVEEQPRYEAKTDEVVSPKDVMASETSSGEKDDTKDRKLDHIPERSAVSESEDVITATPTSEQVENLGKTGTDFGGTTGTTVVEEEPRHDALLGGISSTTEKSEIDKNIDTEPAKTFSVEEKAELPKDNLERSIGLEEEPQVPGSRPEAYTPPNYQTEVTDPSGVGKDEIEEITPVEESFAKLNVQDEPKHTQEPNVRPTTVDSEYPPAGSHDQFVPHLSAAKQTQNPSAGSHDQFNQETISTNVNRNLENPTETGQTFNTISTTVEEQPLYKANTDEVVSSEDVITSEEGLGEKDEIKDKVVTNEEQQKSGDDSNMSGSNVQYGKNIAQSLTQKLTPVYEKVAGVGTAVKSKVAGTSTVGNGTETQNGVKEQDKGVSVKDYLAEKLKPGEEDKALSEVISEALNKPKEEAVKKEDRNLDGGDEKVSEESSVSSPGKGVVGKLKGVVGSWFGKSDEKVAGDGDLSKNTNSGAEVEQVNQVVGENKSSPIEEQGTR